MPILTAALRLFRCVAFRECDESCLFCFREVQMSPPPSLYDILALRYPLGPSLDVILWEFNK